MIYITNFLVTCAVLCVCVCVWCGVWCGVCVRCVCVSNLIIRSGGGGLDGHTHTLYTHTH